MEYSNFCENAIERIGRDIDGYLNLEGKKCDDLDAFFKTDFIVEFIKCGNVNKTKTLRSLLRLLGITIDDNYVSRWFSAKQIEKILSQVKPVAKYMSMAFIHRMVKGFNSLDGVDPSSPETLFNIIKKMSSKNKLTDFLLGFVSDVQFTSTNNENEMCSLVNMRSNKKKGGKNNTSSNSENIPQSILSNKEAALKEEVQRLKKQLEKKNVSVGSDELFVERLEESIASVAPSLKFKNEKWRGDNSFKKNHEATEVLHISDWHIGEVDNIGGFNRFNYNIACDRVKTLTNKVLSWTRMHRSMYRVDELVVIATGDMISGEIHDELRRTNEFPAPEQCVKAAMLISKMVNELSSAFKKVRVEYIVADNHSRTTKKIEFAPGTNSYNYIVGTMAKIMLRDNQTVEFNLYPEIQHVVKVEGLQYLITHGNSIRGGFAGIPYYGMNRKLGAEALIRMNMDEDCHFNRIVMGHYHTPFLNNGVEMTGCLSSTTAFDHAAGRHSPACQTAWLVSKKFEMDYSIFWLS